MTTAPQPAQPAPVCCGQTSGAWVPKPGEPVVPGCQLCPRSETYWRTAKGAARQ